MHTHQPCPQCERLAQAIRFSSDDAADFVAFHSVLLGLVKSGVLRIEAGDLQWADHIDCTLRCSRCDRHFRLACETYHGRGGEWRIEASR